MRPAFNRQVALRTFGLCAAVGAVTLYAATDVRAAVRMCRSPVSGAVSEAKTVQEAKRLALASWVARAGQYGAGYAGWRTANNKRIACRAGSNGVTRCQATARPCTIAQNPRLQRPKQPRKKAQGIDA
jgi:hypothetical protein